VKEYYTYIMCNRSNRVLYIGMTNDLSRRVLEHKHGECSSFARKYNCKKLVWYETFSDPNEAIKVEKRLKRWSRKWKLDLIEKSNPGFKDLAEDVYIIRQ